MRTSAVNLKQILKSNIVEIKFIRRVPKPGAASTRRMLCTNSRLFLSTYSAREVFNFTPPTSPPRYNDITKNLVTTFDLFLQRYRNINAITADLITVIPVKNQEQINDFWTYFNKNLLPMQANEKQDFMNV